MRRPFVATLVITTFFVACLAVMLTGAWRYIRI